MVEEFINNEKGYMKWISKNPFGFVINTTRSMSTDYMVLHRAMCQSISIPTHAAGTGGFTERQYIKICSNDIKELKEWVKEHGRTDGRFSSKCSLYRLWGRTRVRCCGSMKICLKSGDFWS